MILVQESTPAYKPGKPILCPKCNRGKLGSIPHDAKISLSRRGKLPTDEQSSHLQVKCPSCRVLLILTIGKQ